ncbi:EVE domain-containing protein [Methylovirgula sp. 4M-Z18]|uniref:EVE domain-containing protein n=1 Tax=Methylovirgula sp. 4M-Z18 TaxID=2293567 RepID=UPI000E2F5583|nr:EVE domain-containing protein [Methylovirgula sp. 4M-Z18]RFB81326.1 EVE domain-containing protein [Methylovirgula sp. 4M-Z18]
MTRDLFGSCPTPQQHWIAVASADHVARGREQGFMQVCHGKAAPLRRIRAGDGIVYYAPVQRFGGHDCGQSFVAIGNAADDLVYQTDMGGGFLPWRRGVMWLASQPAAIRPLLDRLEFTRGQKSWGYAFRFGLLQVSAHDMGLIVEAMHVGAADLFSPGAGRAKTVR